MNSVTIVQRLYDACGFRLKPLMRHRVLGAPASDLLAGGLHEVVVGEPATAAGVAGPSPKDGVGRPLRPHDDVAFERKMWRARRAARLISYLPFVRGIAVCNSLAFHMVHEESDVDLLIIAAAGRVWSARWWVTGVLALLRMRPGEALRDPVCVSFFVDERVTDLSPFMIERDVYFYYWLRTMMPLSGDHELFAGGARTAPEFRVRMHRSRARELFAGIFSEYFVRRQQLAIMPAAVRDRAALGDTTVVLSDQVIKLHQNDRRQELRDQVFV